MPSSSRKFAQSWAAKIILGLIIVAMAGFGVSQYGFDAIKGDQVVKAGSRTVTSADFRREYDNNKKQIEQQQGQPITPEVAEQNNLDTLVLNKVVVRESFFEILSRAGLHPSDNQVLAQIQKIPAFFDQITGRFDKKTFETQLAQNGLTPPKLDGLIRDDLANQQWQVAIQNGLGVPRTYGALAAVFAMEARDVSYFVLTPASVPAPANPTDAQLTAFINENKAALTVPEMRILTIVPFTPQAVTGALGPIDPAELKKRYDFRKDTLSKPETRSLVQIPVKDQAAAAKAIARLKAGEAPAAVAKSLGVDAVEFTDKPLTAVADRKVGQAAFKMQAGEIAAVPGDLGLAVVKIVSVTPGREISLEEARPMLEAEVRKDMLAEKVYAQIQAYDDAHQGGASLADAAKKAGVTTTTIGPISAQGVDLQNRRLQGMPPQVLQTAFGLPEGGDSEVTDIGEGNSFAVRVEKIVPAHVRPLEEIRDQVTQVWMQRELAKALKARADALVARVRKGESLEAVAASAGVKVANVAGVTRQTAQTQAALGQELLGRTFAGRPGELFTAAAPTGIAVARIGAVRMAVTPQAAQFAEAQRRDLTVALFREMEDSAHAYAVTKLKTKRDPVRARAAAGFEPLETPTGKDAKPGPKA